MRLGDLDTLKEEFDFIADKYGIGEKKYISIKDIKMIIDKAPTKAQKIVKALSNRPQGEWLFTEIDENCHVYGQCSICKERNRIGKACRSCGAEMKGGKKND